MVLTECIGLVCIHCRSSRLINLDRALECSDCGTSYPVLAGIPVIFDDVSVCPGPKPDPETARQILSAFGLPTDPITTQRVREFFGRKARYGGLLIETEAEQFLDRVRNTGYELNPSPGAAPDAVSSLVAAPRSDGKARPRWTQNYVPRRLPPATELLANVRFENIGDAPMQGSGTGHYNVAVRWSDASGHPVPGDDVRTPLPIDLLPGRALTLPVRLQTPPTPGRYTLSLLMVQEGVRWLDDDLLRVPVQITEDSVSQVPTNWWMRDEEFTDYNADHQRGMVLLRGWIEAHAPAHPRILEVGGNAIPMIEELDGELYNIDVDLLGLQVCRLRQRQRQRQRAMAVLCADANNLPFPPNFFDVIVIFASLHHFPNPASLLAGLRGRLKPGGFLGVMCEPVGHIWPGAVMPAYLAELQRGVNEQSFTPEEYTRIFNLAELDAAEAIVDKSSLKARLVARAAA